MTDTPNSEDRSLSRGREAFVSYYLCDNGFLNGSLMVLLYSIPAEEVESAISGVPPYPVSAVWMSTSMTSPQPVDLSPLYTPTGYVTLATLQYLFK